MKKLSLLLSAAVFASAATLDLKVAGAKGDGSADDTAAIRNAINRSHVGDTIVCPSGNFKITATVTFKSSRTYQGRDGCTLTGSIGAQLVQLEDGNGHDVIIDGWTFNGGGIVGNGAAHANRVTISNNTFQNILNSGYNTNGIHFTSGISNSKIQGNTFTNIYDSGNPNSWSDACGAIWLWDTTSVTITQNTFNRTCQAIHVTINAAIYHDLVVSGNTIHRTARYNIEIQGNFGMNNVTVNNNYIDTPQPGLNGQAGISLAVGGTGHQIKNNVLLGPNQGLPKNQSDAIEAMGAGFLIDHNIAGHWGVAQLIGWSDNTWQTTNNVWCDMNNAAPPANIISLEDHGQSPTVSAPNTITESCSGVTFAPPAR